MRKLDTEMRTPVKGLKMSKWRAAVCALAFLWATASAKAGSVRVEPLHPCSQQPRITVLRDGKPAAGITVELSRVVNSMESVFATLRTDARGEVVLPKLSRAVITVDASWNSGSMTIPDLAAGLVIQYRPDNPAAKDHFTMELSPNPDPGDAALAAALAIKPPKAAEAKPMAEVQQFRGVVAFGPGSGGIPDVAIAVARLHGEPRPVMELHSDALGHFSAQLPPGDYVAAFISYGLEYTVQPVTINAAAKQSGLRILMRPASVME
ncbi:MAG: hypothetical protein WBW84_06325 [Acidobacteriaceae bacterium]